MDNLVSKVKHKEKTSIGSHNMSPGAKVGVFLIAIGIGLLIAQSFIDPNKPRPPHWIAAKEYKQRMIAGGVGSIVLGVIATIVG